MLTRTIYLATFALIVLGCSTSKEGGTEESIGSIKKRVMAVHDEVMPKMDDLYKIQKQLLKMADSLKSDSLIAAKYRELADEIELANESMMDWMRKFEPNYEGTEEAIKAYLEDQEKSIIEVKERMINSLEAGRKELQRK